MCATVHRADLQSAVFSCKALEALTLSIHAAAPILTVLGTVGFGAVGARPARLTQTSTGFGAVVSMTVAIRFSSHLTYDEKSSQINIFCHKATKSYFSN